MISKYGMATALACLGLTNGCFVAGAAIGAATQGALSNVKAPRQNAQNPLGGTPIVFSQQAAVPDSTTCTVPTVGLSDEYSITATPEQICISGTGYFDSREREKPGPIWGYQFTTDTAHSAPMDMTVVGKPRAISQCSDRYATKIVWESQLKGCVANKGLLTTSTKELAMRMFENDKNHVGAITLGGKTDGPQGNEVKAWTFPAATSTIAASAAATSKK